MSTTPKIHLATHADIPIILELIRELASYEYALDSVQATEATLARTLSLAPTSGALPDQSNPSGYAKTLLLTAPEDEPAGMALFFYNYSTWRAKPGVYLEDLYVRPKYRRRGYGRMLMQELAREVQRVDGGCEGGRLDWMCLKWNEPSLKFYETLGAVQMQDWIGLRVQGDALKRLAAGQTGNSENGKT